MSVHDGQSTPISNALFQAAKRWHEEDLERQKGAKWYIFEWDCVAWEDDLSEKAVEERSEWTEAAYVGDWEKLFRLAIERALPRLINSTRLQRTKFITSGNGRPLSGFTALHQAAWHGAPVEVVRGLLDLGAYRWMRTTEGKLPLDVARLRGHSHLYGILEPPNYLPEWSQEDLKSIERLFHELIEMSGITKKGRIRLPNLEMLREIKGRTYMAVPGMLGGFSFQLESDHLVVDSTYSVVDVIHHITPMGVTVAREGWN